MRMRAGLLVLAVLLGACGGGGGGQGIEYGLKRIALDLAFEAKDVGEATPDVALRTPIPVPSVGQLQQGYSPRPLPVVPRTECPTAPPGSVPRSSVQSRITRLPAMGQYTYNVKGTFELQSAVFPLKGPLPPLEMRTYQNGVLTPGERNAVTGANAEPTIDFEVFQQGLVPGTSMTRSYRVTPTDLLLTKLVTTTADGEVVFEPTPPITIMKMGVTEGETWVSAGTDTETGTSMVVQGTIERREPIDVCGEMIDAYRVTSTERIVNLSGSSTYTSSTSDTNNAPGSDGPGKPNVYHVATHFGGVLVADEQHTITQLNSDLGPVTVIVDSVSTLTSTTPRPAS